MSKIHIGKEIRMRVKRKGIKAETLAKLLNVSIPNIYKIYERQSMDTGLLSRICQVVDYNFFTLYAKEYRTEQESDAFELCQKENSMLRNILKEKEEMYEVLMKQMKVGKSK